MFSQENMLIRTILLAVAINLANTEFTPWKCAQDIITADVSNFNTYFFPSVTTSGIPYYAPQSCRWSLTVPVGTYAYLKAYMNLNSNDTFTMSNGPRGIPGSYNHGYDSVNNDVPRVVSNYAKFFIPPGNYTISFTAATGTTGSFAFEVSLNDLPSRVDLSILANEQHVAQLSTLRGKQFSLPSSRTFTLRTIAGGCNVNTYIFDGCHVYKGQNAANGTFLDGLSRYLNGVPLALAGDVTVVCFGNNDIPTSSGMYITGMPDLPPGGTWQITDSCPYLTFSGIGVADAYATDYCPQYCTKYVSNVQFFNSNATLDMYSGSIGSSFTLLGSINNKNVKEKVPQMISGGNFKTFRVSKGTASITLDKDPGTWKTASAPRSGFFASPFYGIPSKDQDFMTVISSIDTKYIFTYTIKDFQDGQVLVSIFQKDGTKTEAFYTNTTYDPKKSYSAAGIGINFSYSPGVFPSKGSLTEYQISPYNSAFKGRVFMVLVAVVALFV